MHSSQLPALPGPKRAEARPSIFRSTVAPLLLLLVCPPLVPILWAVVARLNGSVASACTREGFATIVANIPRPTMSAVWVLLVYTIVTILLLKLVPGKLGHGPLTPAGNRPQYRLNGVACYVGAHTLYWVGVWSGWYPATIIFDHLGALLSTLCIFALLFCGFLYFKGRFFPTNTDTTFTGNPLFDYFQGVELHPRMFGVDLKQLCNCRLSMTGWSLLVVSFAAKQHALYGRVSWGMWIAVLLQVAYLFKFFVWEAGYFASLDITHDRFGYYICWGVLCWVPLLYTLGTFYLVTHPSDLPRFVAPIVLALGIASLAVNYAADRQRQRVRQTGGNTTVWGRAPVLIHAPYETSDGRKATNLLLASGYWGIARHFHYVPELLLALAWTLPAGVTHVLPYFYFIFLFILLMDRAGRDDLRCEAKYGAAWLQYRSKVPYKVLPGVY